MRWGNFIIEIKFLPSSEALKLFQKEMNCEANKVKTEAFSS